MSTQTCRQCGTEFEGRADAAYCSPGCKQKAYRKRNAAPVTGAEEELRQHAEQLKQAWASWTHGDTDVIDAGEDMARSIESFLRWLGEE